mmetsp:Transcript_12445/g.34937  ORF Transcript_12445/g.34937 Transcript_12445/m.34937 type:complete len:308 (+) Transcript_12445:3383-4306(+)
MSRSRDQSSDFSWFSFCESTLEVLPPPGAGGEGGPSRSRKSSLAREDCMTSLGAGLRSGLFTGSDPGLEERLPRAGPVSLAETPNTSRSLLMSSGSLLSPLTSAMSSCRKLVRRSESRGLGGAPPNWPELDTEAGRRASRSPSPRRALRVDMLGELPGESSLSLLGGISGRSLLLLRRPPGRWNFPLEVGKSSSSVSSRGPVGFLDLLPDALDGFGFFFDLSGVFLGRSSNRSSRWASGSAPPLLLSPDDASGRGPKLLPVSMTPELDWALLDMPGALERELRPDMSSPLGTWSAFQFDGGCPDYHQ